MSSVWSWLLQILMSIAYTPINCAKSNMNRYWENIYLFCFFSVCLFFYNFDYDCSSSSTLRLFSKCICCKIWHGFEYGNDDAWGVAVATQCYTHRRYEYLLTFSSKTVFFHWKKAFMHNDFIQKFIIGMYNWFRLFAENIALNSIIKQKQNQKWIIQIIRMNRVATIISTWVLKNAKQRNRKYHLINLESFHASEPNQQTILTAQ